MADTDVDAEAHSSAKMTSDMKYYYRHREEKIAKDLARYHSRPDVIAKREERERKKAEKDAEKESKRLEKERVRQEKIALAEATRQKKSLKSDGGLDEFIKTPAYV